MVARSLGCNGLDRSALIERLAKVLTAQGVTDSQEWHALAELISPGTATIRFGSITEQYEVIRHYLARSARGPAGKSGASRPVILWVDDAQWGMSTLEVVQYVVETQEESPLPLLVVMTVQTTDLPNRRAESLLLSEILDGNWARRIEVEPLPPAQRQTLVRELVGLEGRLATQIEERTGGNPLFAVQLVGDWIDRGLLVASPEGFLLQEDATLDLPDSLQEVWADRLEHLLRGQSEAKIIALELAAILGQEVSGDEWRSACALAQADPSQELIEVLLRERLIQTLDEGPQAGFSFVHGMLRETLALRSRDEGRSKRLHQVCASTLAGRTGRSIPERRGRHLISAERYADALPFIWEGVRNRLRQGQVRIGAVLLEELNTALDKAGHPERCAERGWAWTEFSRLHRLQGNYVQADNYARRAVDCGTQSNDIRLQGESFLALGLVNGEQGEYERALKLFRRGERLANAARDIHIQARCRQEVANCFRRLGSLDQAKVAFTHALADFRSVEDGVGAAGCLRGLGEVARQALKHQEAQRLLTQARSAYHKEGHRWGEGMSLNALGEIQRYQGDLKRAEATYRMALERLKAIGSPDESYPRVNLALIHLEKGRYREARRRLEESLATFKRLGRQAMIGCVHLALLPCLGHFRDWTTWDIHFAKAQETLRETGIKDVDLARLAVLAGEVALKAGSRQRTRLTWQFAAEHWEALGQKNEALVLRERLKTLDMGQR
jgi:tetratricopeptide (TPR) repeat protein